MWQVQLLKNTIWELDDTKRQAHVLLKKEKKKKMSLVVIPWWSSRQSM